jgi:hypothetical protein
MTNAISTYLKYANVQMAAEALFNQQGNAPGSTFSGPITDANIGILTLGNNRTSRFTAIQADEFSKDWSVVEHISNTPTGFSGTLFRAVRTDEARGIKIGELVISFRSTEFIDDSARDAEATNNLEIKAHGWAFGQIGDMQDWYASLKSSGKIPSSRQITVTGYSLGGHLATAFGLLHKNDLTAAYTPLVAATYTFNGAGVGQVNAGHTLQEAIDTFRQYRNAPVLVTFDNTELDDVYMSICGRVAPMREAVPC